MSFCDSSVPMEQRTYPLWEFEGMTWDEINAWLARHKITIEEYMKARNEYTIPDSRYSGGRLPMNLYEAEIIVAHKREGEQK